MENTPEFPSFSQFPLHPLEFRHSRMYMSIETMFCSAPGSRVVNRPRIISFAWLITLLAGFAADLSAQIQQGDPLELWFVELNKRVPRKADGYNADTTKKMLAACEAIEKWVIQKAEFRQVYSSAQAAPITQQLISIKRRVDELLESALTVRQQFAALKAGPAQRDAMRNYLRTTSELIDLSGRLRYALNDIQRTALSRFLRGPNDRAQLLDLLIREKCSIGALVLVEDMMSPDESRTGNELEIYKLLQLISVTGQNALIPQLTLLLESPDIPPGLLLTAVETVRNIGLPQEPRPGDPDDLPPPPITARRVLEIISKIAPSQLSKDEAARHAKLVEWLDNRIKKGVTEDSYRLGHFDVKPGDWLLMRNPSPYNLFTDLSPGLFTHVGVVTTEDGSDGIRRMVLVDLPERGSKMPATNVETYVLRTLHCMFLRHPDPEVAKKMSDAARDTIGNPTEFDLNFRTQRVLDLKGQSLVGRKIHTYCAGLLLLTALQTDQPREDFFPITEFPAGGYAVENLAKLGMSLGEDFISPTGALFSTKMQIAGRREPMYDPRREIEEKVFDFFADSLETKVATPAPDLFKSIRMKLAEASKSNPLLAQALAQAAGVSAEMDLAAAAKAAAVVETIDEAAFGASKEYQEAREAMRLRPQESLAGRTEAEIAQIRKYRQRHADLYNSFHQGTTTPRQLRIKLVEYYIKAGQAELERRYFTPEKTETPTK